ncbi:peptide ABC transporter substrate-binding protein [Streptomyces sp. 150FB]|uniref:peptide ABC transporter substrate-binding protein n=1 Tax=Streptomyces sp. 150FB TaxID=1576605 RepID=UPI000588FF6F|nr:ABC transporter substrate-binding protein [Streptomyces sp. 150FB]KIF76526.1 peptide ABC transporter substrate-binding protein [Streptomyces sp. 150FB]
MRGAKSAKWVVGAAVVALAATACGGGGGDSSSDKGAADPNGKVVFDSGEPQNALQPANTQESYGASVIDALFVGLVKYEPGNGKITNVNAQSVTSSDNKVWTVKLNPGWKFTNGETVTSKSYVDAWNWAADTKSNQISSSWFSDIAGYTDVHPEKGAPKTDKMSGLKVVDDNTFTITLTSALPYFQYKLGYRAFDPLPAAFYKDPKAYGEKPVGNGPYKFDSWQHKKTITVSKNADYKGPDPAKNGGVVFKNYATEDAAYQDLLSNNLDIIRQIPPSSLANYKSDLGDRAVTESYSAIQTINPAFYTKQWKDIDVRVLQGLSMAIDRDTITKTVLQGTRTPATGWVAQGVLGYKAGACGEFCSYDPAKAKALIKAGGGVPGNKITVQYNADGGHKEWVDAVCNSIRQATGVDCTGDSKPDFQTDTQIRDAHQVKSFYRSGWVLDYPFNGNFLRDLYGTGVAGNSGGFSDKKFDALTKEADQAKTVDESAAAYQKAEAELVNSFPSIPLWYYNLNSGFSTKVSNVKYDQAGDPILTGVTVKK